VVNKSIEILRAVFQEAAEVGARSGNPAMVLKRSKARPKKIKLPSRQEFPQCVATIETGGTVNMRVHEWQKSMDLAAKIVGVERITPDYVWIVAFAHAGRKSGYWRRRQGAD
jgi:hypothetical protein